jgi:histidyl-tRNA synthetase
MEACEIPAERRVVALTLIDKQDKIGNDGVRAELLKADFAEASVAQLMEAIALTGAPETVMDAVRPLIGDNPRGMEALRDLGEIFARLRDLGVPDEHVAFDLALVRALSYYTGTIYETVLRDSTLGSLGGGGRYDELIGAYLGRDLPCVGISFGIDRIFDALDEKGLIAAEAVTTTQALVTLFGPETVPASLTLATRLRRADVRTEVYPEPRELKAQLSFANKKGVPLAFILGPDELARGQVTLRDLRTGDQHAVSLEDAPARAKEILG